MGILSSEKTFLQIQELQRLLNSSFAQCSGISMSRMQLLFHVYQSQEINQTELQKLMGINHAAITRHLKQLEADNMVTRRTSSQDNRITLVKITEDGCQQVAILRESSEQFLKQMMSGFSEHEMSQLSAMLQRIIQNLSSS
ncbi:MarR family winged helix-turn-helix transcriptional regulator [Metabacillus arenae]|uniref:MarR family transcriptional regulator n=1 Tax=Metabacillus arenae TaxID=2771434 RepID=A0A926NKJ0_9BACI|nr:MarR family transcriptional regulator [Metabacillus arenae]MBD1382440.1 MarR family transcriptional regulator [Metabacillus arenae]